MSTVVKNLDELAAIFQERARNAEHFANLYPQDSRDGAHWRGVFQAWTSAAGILLRTTITEDAPCREII